jgi:hypothetical protein
MPLDKSRGKSKMSSSEGSMSNNKERGLGQTTRSGRTRIQQQKLRCITHFGHYCREYVILRIYHLICLISHSDVAYCTINLLDSDQNADFRVRISLEMQNFVLFLDLFVNQILSSELDIQEFFCVVSDLIEIYKVEMNNCSFQCNNFLRLCQKMLSLSSIFVDCFKHSRLDEAYFVKNEIVKMTKKIFVIANVFNNFASTEMLKVLTYQYSSKKALQSWHNLIET